MSIVDTYLMPYPSFWTEDPKRLAVFGAINDGQPYMLGMALREAKRLGIYPQAARLAMAQRQSRLAYVTRLQRDWQSKVSHRPQRGRHHDSWKIREKYVRAA
jgi:hypothetical protein